MTILILMFAAFALVVALAYISRTPGEKEIHQMLSKAYHSGFENGMEKAKKDMEAAETGEALQEAVQAYNLNEILAKTKAKPKKKKAKKKK